AAETEAHVSAQAVLPIVDAFEQRALVRRAGRASAELVRIFQLPEELQRIVDAIDAKFQCVNVEGAELDRGLASRARSAIAVEREIPFGLRLAECRSRCRQQRQCPQRLHAASLKMFHRYTPRN